jgi:hypothetical protein
MSSSIARCWRARGYPSFRKASAFI